MKTIRYLTCLLLVALLLTACAQGGGQVSQPGPDPREVIQQAITIPNRFSLEPVTVEHGEDYVIDWEDAGMEEHIRFLLDKPDGDILHSDVWDVQILTIQPDNGRPHDVMLTQPPEGSERFEWEKVFYLEFKEGVWKEYGFREFTPIKSLRDLRHFDSLQFFEAYLTWQEGPELTDLSGVECCTKLIELCVYNARPGTLEPLGQMPWLKKLTLSDCGKLDLSPLTVLSELNVLSVDGCELVSLEPLAMLPSLRTLHLGFEATYPSLEPLTRSTVENLDLGLSVSGRDKYDSLDYAHLTQIPSLIYLDVSNHTAFDADDCTAVLENSPNLKYLDISYTPAANAIKEGDWEADFSQLEAYMTLPD